MSDTILTLGNLTIDDIVIYETGQVFRGCSGGNALFATIGAKVWHPEVGIIARASVDYPDENVERITSAGVELHLHRVKNPDIHDWALYEAGGGRQFVNHLTSGTHYEMSITGEEIPADCRKAAGYHIAPMPTDVQATIVRELSGNPGLVSLDPHLDYLAQPDMNRLAGQLLEEVDFFIPSREEAAALLGRDDPKIAAQAFSDLGANVVAIKMSTQGSLLYLRATKEMFQIPIYRTEAVDPTGAGDAYCGGFVAGYIQTGDPVIAACYGTVSASYIVEQVGALNCLHEGFSSSNERLEDVRSRVKKISVD